MALGATRSPELAAAAGRVLGRELLALGCNLNFAPVLDLATHLESNVVGLRAFSDDPRLTARLGAALLGAMQEAGVLATVKHFPGHGATQLDSHHAAPLIDRSLEELMEHELVPFKAAIEAGVAAVMSAHVRYPALDGQPATHSALILESLLREQLGFAGLILTDAMDMHAIAELPPLERCRLAVHAGADLVLLGHLPDQEKLVAELLPETRPESSARVQAARAGLSREFLPLEIIGEGGHQAVARSIADASVTLLRGSARLDLRAAERLLLISIEAGDLTPAETSSGISLALGAQIRQRHPDTLELTLPFGSSSSELSGLLRQVAGLAPDRIIIATVNAVSDAAQVTLVRELVSRGHDPLVVALRSPLDALALPFVKTVLCSYGRRGPQTEAVARALFGELIPAGELPVSAFATDAAERAP
jgi:beta-N-acetylhexosaminidase